MAIKIDLTGQKFGRLMVISEAIDKDKWGHRFWECQCDCGKIIVTKGNSLRNGETKSCGCLKQEVLKKMATKHGMSKMAAYKSWVCMLDRCNNPKNNRYHDWGGRGIRVCRRWLTFENFFEDMGERPEGMSIERINNNLGYFKANCEYATSVTQNRNKRIYKNNTTGVQGVSWDKNAKKYRAGIEINSKNLHLGLFINLEDAKHARKQAEKQYWEK